MGILDFLLNSLMGGSNSSASEMSDQELQRKLDRGVGKNTGESLAQRASYIREGESRGISANQKKK